jgi:hypothetical protein
VGRRVSVTGGGREANGEMTVSCGGLDGEKRAEGKNFDGEGVGDFLSRRWGEAWEGAGWRGTPRGGVRWGGPQPDRQVVGGQH